MTERKPVPIYGVIGSPISHSRSPALHRAAYRAIGFSAAYDSTEVREGGLDALVRAAPRERRGFSVTMPLKREAFVVAAERDRHAELTGAVNTLHRGTGPDDAPFSGSNTDVGGIVDAVRAGAAAPLRHVLVLGGGATAASAIVAAAELGAGAVTIAVRSHERATGGARLGESLGLASEVVRLDQVDRIGADLVVSTLPGGAALEVMPDAARDAGALLLDAAYSPWPGVLVAHWLDDGRPVVHGLSMLVHQAARQVRLFAGLDDESWSENAGRVTAAMFDVVGLDRSGVVAPPVRD